jgi:hypothetical protein
MTAHDIILGIMAATGAAIITSITILLDPIIRAAGARRRAAR